MGSFLLVLAYRLPKGEDVIRDRSHCHFCRHRLIWYELIPLVSYILQKGRTRCCRKMLPYTYPLVELITAVGFVFLYQIQIPLDSMGGVMLALRYVVFCSFVVIFVADLTYEVIPIEMVIGAFAAGSINMLLYWWANPPYGIIVWQHIAAGLGAGLFFWALWIGTKGKAMGDGDIYLGGLIGFLLGYPHVIIALYLAFLTGAIVGIILMIGKRVCWKSHIPFGPFLIAGYVMTIFFGDYILQMWRVLW